MTPTEGGDTYGDGDGLARRLHATDDAMVWAEEFIATLDRNPDIVIDAGLMVGWFANAMQIAVDFDRRCHK